MKTRLNNILNGYKENKVPITREPKLNKEVYYLSKGRMEDIVGQ